MTTEPTEPKDQDDGVLASIVVLIEWGGKKPSSTFYNRMHAYGLYSREPESDKAEFSLMDWRASRNGHNKSDAHRGLILQEGAIMVSSVRLANDIAGWAKAEGCLFVHIGHMVTKEFSMSAKDQKAFEALQKNIGKRGPKRQAEIGKYAVTCMSEVKTYQVDLEATPFMCPYCGGSNIVARMGEVNHFQLDFEGSPEDYWKRTRFASGSFEIPEMSRNEKGKPVAKSPKLTVPEIGLPSLINLPISLQERCSEDIQTYWHLLDIAFCVSQYSEVQRLDGRLLVINSFIVSGGTRPMSFNPPKDGVDLIDLTIVDGQLAEYL